MKNTLIGLFFPFIYLYIRKTKGQALTDEYMYTNKDKLTLTILKTTALTLTLILLILIFIQNEVVPYITLPLIFITVPYYLYSLLVVKTCASAYELHLKQKEREERMRKERELHEKVWKDTMERLRRQREEAEREFQARFYEAFNNNFSSSFTPPKVNPLPTHLQTLGLGPDVRNLEIIKRQYRKLAKQHHPDISKDGGEKFKQISIAYKEITKILSA